MFFKPIKHCCSPFQHYVKNYCFSYGYPQKFLIDNGGEFCNAKLKLFCEENQIKRSHGGARTPTTQGLVARSNKTWKENMRSIIMGSNNKNIERWCEYTIQASYTMTITLHGAINTYLLLTEFSVRTVSYGPSFFPLIYGPRASRLGHKSTGKNEDP